MRTQSMDRLTESLVSLAADADLQHEFRQNPHGVVEQFKLSRREKIAILSRKAADAREAFGAMEGTIARRRATPRKSSR